MTDSSALIPVNLITGFLGSGKTTLLQRLLRDPALSDTAVLINEFGEVGLDHYLLERIDETMVLLQSGCLCCTIRGSSRPQSRTCIPSANRGAYRSSGGWWSRARGLPIHSRSSQPSMPIRC